MAGLDLRWRNISGTAEHQPVCGVRHCFKHRLVYRRVHQRGEAALAMGKTLAIAGRYGPRGRGSGLVYLFVEPRAANTGAAGGLGVGGQEGGGEAIGKRRIAGVLPGREAGIPEALGASAAAGGAKPQVINRREWKPGADHPWKKGVVGGAARQSRRGGPAAAAVGASPLPAPGRQTA